MSRYNLNSKKNLINSDIVLIDEDIDQFPEQQQPSLINTRFKSIPSKQAFHQLEHESFNEAKPKKQKPIDEMKLQYTDSTQKMRINNYFGSRKVLDRKLQPTKQIANPENQPRQRRQVNDEDQNQKLANLIKKQIEDRQKWQESKKQQMNDNYNGGKVPTDLIITQQKQQKQSGTSLKSQLKLKKLSQQKFAANNIQQNNLFKQNNNGQDSVDYLQKQSIDQKSSDQISPIIYKKKREVSELKPLRKKNSTYQVMNQCEFLKRNNEGDNFTTIDDNNPSKATILTNTQQPSPVYEPAKFITVKKHRVIAQDIKQMHQFNTQVIPKHKFIEGLFRRYKETFESTFFPEYRFVVDQINIILAKKTMSGYDIMMDPTYSHPNHSNYLGFVKGNFKGSEYNICQESNQRQIIATIFYHSSTQSAGRQLQLYVKDQSLRYDELDHDNPNDNTSNLKALYLQGQNKKQKKIRKFINKKPIFDQKSQMYVLSFGSKVTIPSVKNVMLIDQEDPRQTVLIFGKCGTDNFYLKAQNPLSPLVVMGFLMSSFNFKFVTQ